MLIAKKLCVMCAEYTLFSTHTSPHTINMYSYTTLRCGLGVPEDHGWTDIPEPLHIERLIVIINIDYCYHKRRSELMCDI